MTEHKERAHAKLGGSSAERWINCTGSVSLIETLPPTPPTEAALEGTRVHEACEKRLTAFLDAKIHGEDKPFTYDKDPDTAETAENYTAAIWKEVLEQSLTGKAYGIEEEVVLDEQMGMYGFVDFWSIHIDDRARRCLTILDFKNGFHEVEVKNNAQFLFYACAMVDEIRRGGKDLDYVYTCVYQPKAPGNPFKKQGYTIAQVDKWKAKFFKAAKAILTNKINFKVGDWCYFCNAKGICKAYAKSVEAISPLSLLTPIETAVVPELQSLPDATLTYIALNAGKFIDFIDAAKSTVIAKLTNGATLKGVKLVLGKAPARKWIKDEEKIAASLKLQKIKPYKPKLIALSEAEKAGAKLDGLYEHNKQSILLVPDTDPRPSAKTAIDVLSEI